MSFKESITSMLKRYGSKVTVCTQGKKISTNAFIQPLRYKSKLYSDKSIGYYGYKDGRYYLYIGDADVEFSRDDEAIIETDGRRYYVHSNEVYYLDNNKLYTWAILVPYTQHQEDDYDTDSD